MDSYQDITHLCAQKIQETAVYTVNQLQRILGIGRNQAYELVNRNEFPVHRIGKKIIIPIITFNLWLMGKPIMN